MSRLLVLFVLLVSLATAGSVRAQTSAPKPASAKPATTKAGQAKAASPKAAQAKAKRGPKNPPVVLYHVNRRETMSLRLRDADGRPVKGVQKSANRFLRCHHTGAQHAINPRLVKLLYQTARHWPGKRVEIVSGYRAPKVAKNPHSPHMQGLACDFRVEGVKATDLRDYLRRTFEKVGVGYYPNSSFVHLDVRKDRSAFWIDYSGPGERAMYSENPGADLRNGRAESFRPSKIEESWANEASDKPGAGSPDTAAP